MNKVLNIKMPSKTISKHEKFKSVTRISHHVTWKQNAMISYFKPIFDYMRTVRHKKLKANKKEFRMQYKCISKCKCKEKIQKFRETEKSEEYKNTLSVLSDQQRSYVDRITEKLQQKTHGEEFSIPEKLMCLSIYDTSETVYEYLRDLIPLPDHANLRKFRKSIPFDTGVTQMMLNRLLNVSSTMKSSDKIVILMLGWIDIDPHLFYSGKLDKIIGFEDWGHSRHDIIADKSIVFAIRGIESDWFLPVAYSFADDPPSISRLVKLFKEVVQCVKMADFKIVAAICDNENWYKLVLDKLKAETLKKRGPDTPENYGTILVHGLEIVPLFNPVNLLIDFRNNMLLNDLEYFVDLTERPEKWDHEREHRIFKGAKKPLIASWKHITFMYTPYTTDYNIDQSKLKKPPLSEIITSIFKEKLSKSEFNCVFKVFNEKVAADLDKLSEENEVIEGKQIPPEGFFTAFILNFLEKLCDSLTGGKIEKDPKYELKTILTESSFHHEFFEVAKIYLHHMRFVDRETQKPVVPVSCLEELITTIIGFQILWRKLRAMDFHFIKTKIFNLEPLDDFLKKYEDSTCAQFSRNFKNHCYLDVTV